MVQGSSPTVRYEMQMACKRQSASRSALSRTFTLRREADRPGCCVELEALAKSTSADRLQWYCRTLCAGSQALVEAEALLHRSALVRQRSVQQEPSGNRSALSRSTLPAALTVIAIGHSHTWSLPAQDRPSTFAMDKPDTLGSAVEGGWQQDVTPVPSVYGPA